MELGSDEIAFWDNIKYTLQTFKCCDKDDEQRKLVFIFKISSGMNVIFIIIFFYFNILFPPRTTTYLGLKFLFL